jgi:hypothetical protein
VRRRGGRRVVYGRVERRNDWTIYKSAGSGSKSVKDGERGEIDIGTGKLTANFLLPQSLSITLR